MTIVPGSPIHRLLVWSLLMAPVAYLLADGLYAARGWSDAIAGVVHVLAATTYALVVVRVVTLTASHPGWSVAVLVAGVVGVAGNVAYGFDTLHVALGDTALVDASGAAALIKPYGLFFPLWLVLSAVALSRAGRLDTAPAAVLGLAGLLWPVAHIANVAPLAVAVNVALVGCFGLLWAATREERTEASALSEDGAMLAG